MFTWQLVYSWVSQGYIAVNLSGGQLKMYWWLCCTGVKKSHETAKHKVNTHCEKLFPSDDCASIWSWPPVKLWHHVKPKNTIMWVYTHVCHLSSGSYRRPYYFTIIKFYVLVHRVQWEFYQVISKVAQLEEQYPSDHYWFLSQIPQHCLLYLELYQTLPTQLLSK